jgi:hypothetical protein
MTIPIYLLLAVLLMIAAVIGSLTPMVPAGLLSIAGILVYWWSTGYTSPGPLFLGAFVLVGLLVLVADYAAGVIAARAGGASTRNSIAGGVVGLVLFFVLGPLGIILGFAGTVFALEVYGGTGTEASAKAALYAVLGALGSGLVQFLLTASLLVAFLVALLL